MKTVRKSIRISEELGRAIDAARGDVSWSRWVERALEAALPLLVDGREETVEITPRSPSPRDVEVARRAELQTAHLPTCRCAVCSS